MSNNDISSRFDGFTNATMSAREFARQITQIQSNKEKPMYKVKTNLLSEYQQGETITDQQRNKLLQENCPQDWFEKIEKDKPWVQPGQYWERDGEVIRIESCGLYSAVIKFVNSEKEDRHVGIGYVPDNYTLLSDDEIKQALTEEAKRRGFEKGKSYDATNVGYPDQTNMVLDVGGFKYKAELDKLTFGDWVIYERGNWAEIIDQTPDIEINGIKFCGVEGGELVFSCGEYIDIDDYKIFYRFVRFHDLKIHRKGEDITDQIKQIASYYS